MTDRRPFLRSIFDAAVAAAHPDVVLSAHLRPAPKGRVICLAAGKGAAAMAAAAERHYLDTLGLDPERLTGLATTRHGHGVPTRRIRVIEAGHPVPDEAGLKAADETLRLAAEATADDLLLVLLSGGGSANWIAPVGVSFTQTAGEPRAVAFGRADRRDEHRPQAPVADRVAGWAGAGQRAEIVTLAIQTPHDDPSAIASGPTVPDRARWRTPDALVARPTHDSTMPSGARSRIPE
jgi:hydroxypyruvate reductase